MSATSAVIIGLVAGAIVCGGVLFNERVLKEFPATWIVHCMRWIMLVAGVLTATMVQAAFTPDAALQSNFGEMVSGSLAQLVVRNWGALIALVGGMLIYGAFNPLQRALVLIVAGRARSSSLRWRSAAARQRAVAP